MRRATAHAGRAVPAIVASRVQDGMLPRSACVRGLRHPPGPRQANALRAD